jgi:hypothetical protein
MSTTPQNFEASLRASVREHMRSQSEPTPDPVSETPVETTPEIPTDAPVEAAPTTPSESPSEQVVAPEAQAPVESPSSEPAPASDVPKTSAVEALTKRGFKVEDQKLAEEYLRIESEFAALKRAEKAKPAQPATDPQPVTTPAVPEPTPVVAPAVIQTQPAQPAPPATAVPPSADMETQVRQLVESDPVCVAQAEQRNTKRAELQALIQYDRNGNIVGGKYADIERQINAIERLIQPAEELKALGIEAPTLDPVTLADYTNKLHSLKFLKEETYRKAQSLAIQVNQHNEAIGSRAQAYQGQLEQQAAAASAEAAFVTEVDTKTQTFMRSWEAAKASAFQKLNVPESLRPLVTKHLQRAAKALDHVLSSEEMPAFMESVINEENEFGTAYHSTKQAEYARMKREDVQAATQAPSGAAAVATPAKTDTQDWEKRLRAEARATFASR